MAKGDAQSYCTVRVTPTKTCGHDERAHGQDRWHCADCSERWSSWFGGYPNVHRFTP